jgi:hypothetical protein
MHEMAASMVENVAHEVLKNKVFEYDGERAREINPAP